MLTFGLWKSYTFRGLHHIGATSSWCSQLFEKPADPIKKAFGRKKLAPNESRSENVSPQMEANHFFLIRPKCCKTFMMIVHLKRGGRVYLTATSAFCIEIANTIEDLMWKGNSYYIIKLKVEKYSLSEDRKFNKH